MLRRVAGQRRAPVPELGHVEAQRRPVLEHAARAEPKAGVEHVEAHGLVVRDRRGRRVHVARERREQRPLRRRRRGPRHGHQHQVRRLDGCGLGRRRCLGGVVRRVGVSRVGVVERREPGLRRRVHRFHGLSRPVDEAVDPGALPVEFFALFRLEAADLAVDAAAVARFAEPVRHPAERRRGDARPVDAAGLGVRDPLVLVRRRVAARPWIRGELLLHHRTQMRWHAREHFGRGALPWASSRKAGHWGVRALVAAGAVRPATYATCKQCRVQCRLLGSARSQKLGSSLLARK